LLLQMLEFDKPEHIRGAKLPNPLIPRYTSKGATACNRTATNK
ncbi:unnamed protein product, partial [marine sediment metagenome]